MVEGAIDLALVDALNDDLRRLERALNVVPAQNSFEGFHTVRIYNLLAHGADFEAVPVHPAVLPICERVLDPGLLISSLSSIAIGPGESAQEHPRRRSAHPPRQAARSHHLQHHVGAHRLHRGQRRDSGHPGSHKADHSPDLTQTYDTVAAEMPKGSVLIWHGSLWHGGGANTTSERRVGIAMNYCAGFIRQQENQQLGLPRETVQPILPTPAGTGRLRPLPRAHRPHRQEHSLDAAPRRRPAGKPRLGLRRPGRRLSLQSVEPRWCGTYGRDSLQPAAEGRRRPQEDSGLVSPQNPPEFRESRNRRCLLLELKTPADGVLPHRPWFDWKPCSNAGARSDQEALAVAKNEELAQWS